MKASSRRVTGTGIQLAGVLRGEPLQPAGLLQPCCRAAAAPHLVLATATTSAFRRLCRKATQSSQERKNPVRPGNDQRNPCATWTVLAIPAVPQQNKQKPPASHADPAGMERASRVWTPGGKRLEEHPHPGHQGEGHGPRPARTRLVRRALVRSVRRHGGAGERHARRAMAGGRPLGVEPAPTELSLAGTVLGRGKLAKTPRSLKTMGKVLLY